MIISLICGSNLFIFNNIYALPRGIDPLSSSGILGIDSISPLTFSTSSSYLVSSVAIDNKTLIKAKIFNKVLENLNDFFDSNSIGGFSDSECLASGLTGGEGKIRHTGVLIIGTNCDDKIEGSGNDEIIYTLAGIDRVFADHGNDIIYGGLGDNRLYGEQGNDILVAGGGANLLDGGPGNDVLIGGLGSNFMTGGDDNDNLISGVGPSIMDGGGGSNSYDCGVGVGIVLDYNPDNGDTVAGECKIINNVGKNLPSDFEDDIPDG